MGHSMSADSEVGVWRATVLLFIARSVAPRLQDQWQGEPGWRAGQVQEGGVRIWWAKGDQAESCNGDEPYSETMEKCGISRDTFSPEVPSLSLFFHYKPAK